MTRDPLGEDDVITLYKYIRNLPVCFVDFWGLETRKILAKWTEWWPMPDGRIAKVPQVYEISLLYEAQCVNGVAILSYGNMNGNLKYDLDSVGFSFLVVGVTTSCFVSLGPKQAVFKSFPCRNNPHRQIGSLNVHWQVKKRTTIGFNPGIASFSFDIGASVPIREWVETEGNEIIILDCCCED